MNHLLLLSMRFLSSGNDFDEDEKEILRYGLELIFLKASFFFVVFALAFVYEKLLETIVFLVLFIPLRSVGGGYHADSRIKCFLMSISMIIIVVFGMKYCQKFEMQALLIIMDLYFSVFIWIKAPIDSENKRLDIEECINFRRKVRMILLFEWILMILAFVFYWKMILFMVQTAIFINGILEMVQDRKNKRG